MLSTNFSQQGQYTDGDLNKDGDIAFPDFLILSTNFGAAAAAFPNAPEPTGAALLVLAACVLGTMRQRRKNYRLR